jgi:hypothetical protein
VIDEEQKPAPPPVAPEPLAGKASESSTLRGSEAERHVGETNETTEAKDMTETSNTATNDGGKSSSSPSDGTAV